MRSTLTPDQTAILAQLASEWNQTVLTTPGLDLDALQSGIEWLYASLLHRPMPTLHIVSSWAEAIVTVETSGMLQQERLKAQLTSLIDHAVYTSAQQAILEQVEPALWHQVNDYFECLTPIRQVWSDEGNTVADGLARTPKRLIYPEFSNYGGFQDHKWVVFFSFFERIGVLRHDPFTRFRQLIQSRVFVFYATADTVCAVEPPRAIAPLTIPPPPLAVLV